MNRQSVSLRFVPTSRNWVAKLSWTAATVSTQVAHFIPADLHAPSTALLQAPYPPSSSFAMPQVTVVDEPVLDDFFAPSLLGSDSPFLLTARNDFGADWNFL